MSEIIEVDVLVIGGGGAAARAALEAHLNGVQVAMIVKGRFGKSGSTAFKVAEIAGYNVADAIVDEDDSPLEHYRDIRNAALGMCNEQLAYILAHEALQTVPDLESMGVKFEKDNGKYLEIVGCFASRPRTHIIRGHSEPILAALKERINQTDIRIIEDSIITDLLVDDGRCQGAVGFTSNGDFFVVKAGAVAIATGGAGQLFLRNLNPSDITGDGYAMALRVGAELVNMEFMQAGLGVLTPKYNIFNGWIWMLHPIVLNTQGKEFIHHYLPENLSLQECMDFKSTHYPFSTRDPSYPIEVSIHKEVLAGRGTERGGVYLDLRHISEENLSQYERGEENLKMWRYTKEWMIRNHIDPTNQMIEVGCFGHAINGGIKINETTETTIEGLFAAGEVAGGPHGADRLGGNMILTCQVFGKRMGYYSAQSCKHAISENRILQLAEGELKKLRGLSAKKGAYKPRDLKQQIKESMWRNVLVVRNRENLETVLRDLENIRLLSKTELEVNNAADLRKTVEVENMILAGEIIATSALHRTESRGSHFREDYPLRDDTNWLKSIILKQGVGGLEMRSERLPVIDVE